jgi:hypothetical protein
MIYFPYVLQLYVNKRIVLLPRAVKSGTYSGRNCIRIQDDEGVAGAPVKKALLCVSPSPLCHWHSRTYKDIFLTTALIYSLSHSLTYSFYSPLPWKQ